VLLSYFLLYDGAVYTSCVHSLSFFNETITYQKKKHTRRLQKHPNPQPVEVVGYDWLNITITGVRSCYCLDFVIFSTNHNLPLQQVVDLGVPRVFLKNLVASGVALRHLSLEAY
jgi:hypothetical protein